MMHFAKKQAFVILHIRPIILFRRQCFLQEVFLDLIFS